MSAETSTEVRVVLTVAKLVDGSQVVLVEPAVVNQETFSVIDLLWDEVQQNKWENFIVL